MPLEEVPLDAPQGRWLLLATVLASGLALLDSTIVNVALPAIRAEFDTGTAALQWVLSGYLLTLSAFLLLGGSLGDRFGRRRVLVVGVVWFAVASLLCGLAPGAPFLVAARALQGVGAALLTPGSLAILQATVAPRDRARAIGAWSGLSGVAAAVGPFAGGWLVEVASWRWIFLLNLPVAALVIAVALRHVPETRNPEAAREPDVAGATVGALGLGGLTFALIEAPGRGLSALVVAAAVVALVGLGAFVVVERSSSHAMLPLRIFASRQFTAANGVTFAVYAGLNVTFFLLVAHLQIGLGYGALAAGAAAFPVTALLLVLSPWAGGLAQRIGPRLPMTVGPVVAGAGQLLMVRIDPATSYVSTVLPAVAVFGFGLSLTVAPLTATVLAAAEDRHAGIASGVNVAVARVAGLLAVALVPVLAGLGGIEYGTAQGVSAFVAGFDRAVLMAAALAFLGGALAWFAIRNDVLDGQSGPARDAQALPE